MPSTFSRLWGRLGRSAEAHTWEDSRREAERAATVPISETADRDHVAIKGTITGLGVQERARGQWLEATLSDGSGAVTLVWMGRAAIPGIEVGRVLRVEGRIGLIDGERRIYNPGYTLL